MFKVTTLDLSKPPKDEQGHVDHKQIFLARKQNLTVSGQLEGETYALALSDIYTFGPTFRRKTPIPHGTLAEFWMIEPEMAFYDIQDNMQLAQDFYNTSQNMHWIIAMTIWNFWINVPRKRRPLNRRTSAMN